MQTNTHTKRRASARRSARVSRPRRPSRVRAGDLVSRECHFRAHPETHNHEIGFARSLLAYELPDGKLKLIDGHLCRHLDSDLEVDMEVFDVNDEEARALLLLIDPLAALAQTQEQIHQRLLEMTSTISPELAAAWQAAAQAALDPKPAPVKLGPETIDAHFLVLVTCRDEPHQVELLKWFGREGLERKALLACGGLSAPFAAGGGSRHVLFIVPILVVMVRSPSPA